MTKPVDLYVIYRLVKAISTPFNETEAFQLGLIDEKGKLLRSPKTTEERDAYDHFDRVVFNIKRILQRVGMDKKYASYAGALLLMKESTTGFKSTDQELEQQLYVEYNELQKNAGKSFKLLNNEMTATGAAVAGTGDDPVHWGKAKGRPRSVGRTINGLAYLKRKKQKNEEIDE